MAVDYHGMQGLGMPGSQHDSQAFRQSAGAAKCEATFELHHRLLADTGYCLGDQEATAVIPSRIFQLRLPDDDIRRDRNLSISSVRTIVEQVFGHVKMKFPFYGEQAFRKKRILMFLQYANVLQSERKEKEE